MPLGWTVLIHHDTVRDHGASPPIRLRDWADRALLEGIEGVLSLPVLVGISMVRNEADVIRANVLHHLAMGLDRLVIVDNGSTDGTDRVLEDLARQFPKVRWSRDDMPFEQSDLFTSLAREAHAEGADWVLPLDADEFWYARGGLKRVLAKTDAVLLRVRLVNFVQQRDQLVSTPSGLLRMTGRIPSPVGPLEEVPRLVEEGKIAHIEALYPPKWIVRPTPTVTISHGNHFIGGVVGGIEDCSEIVCFHAALRSRERMEQKGLHGRRVEAARERPGESWHVRRFRRLQDEGRLDEEWAANSVRAGYLDVFGLRHPVIHDPTLRNLLMPYLASTPWGRSYARLKNRIAERFWK